MEQNSDQAAIEQKFNKYKKCILVEYLASRLKDEQILVKYFNSILNVKFRDIRRKEKKDEIKQNMNNLINAAKVCIKYKDLTIQLLKTQFNDYDQLSQHVVNHSIIVKDDLIANFNNSIDILKRNFTKEIESIKDFYKNELITLKNLNEESLKNINSQMICFESNANDINLKEVSLLRTEQIELKIRYQDDKTVYKIESEKIVTQLELEYINQKKTYENNLLYLRRTQALNQKAELLDKIILKDRREIKLLNERIKEVKEKFSSFDDILLSDKKKFLSTKIKQYNSYFKYLKNEQDLRYTRLTKLVVESSKAIDFLKEKNFKVSKIFTFLKICRKQEEAQQIKFETNSLNNSTCLNDLFNHANDFDSLLYDELHRNINECNLRNTEINIEIKSLELLQINLKKENNSLRNSLKQYFESINK